MADDMTWDFETRRDDYGLGRAAAATHLSSPTGPALLTSTADLQTQLNRAYLSGNGAEVERVLTLIGQANLALPPKGSHRAA